MEQTNYVKPIQISKYQTGKKLVELVSRLKAGYPPVNPNDNIVIHHKWSKIGLNVVDYSRGTGVNSVTVNNNLDISTVNYLLEVIRNMMFLSITKPTAATFDYSEDKIIPERNSSRPNGKCKATKFRISRIPFDKNGTRRYQPWNLQLETGFALPEKTATGGTMAQKGSYEKAADVYITMSDKDIYSLFLKAKEYISLWEGIAAENLIKYELNNQYSQI